MPGKPFRATVPQKTEARTKTRFNSAGEPDERHDVYERVTARILADLEKGVRPWVQPWESGEGGFGRPLRHNGQPYDGINVLMLWSVAFERGYASPTWMTFRQARELGAAHVRKGEKGSLVVYANRLTKVETNDWGEGVEREIPLVRGYTVFNAEQIDGLPEHYYAKPAPKFAGPAQRIGHCGRLLRRIGGVLDVPASPVKLLDHRHLTGRKGQSALLRIEASLGGPVGASLCQSRQFERIFQNRPNPFKQNQQ